MGFRKIFSVMAVICMLVLLACGPKINVLDSQLDTPENHVKNGDMLLKTGKIDAAFHEFTRAKELDPMYPQAYIGLSLVHGINGDYETSFEYMKKAIDMIRATESQ